MNFFNFERKNIQKNSKTFTLESNNVFLNGNVGTGKTYFIKKTIDNFLNDKDTNENFILINMHADFGDLSNKLLEKGYNLYMINNNTKNKFVQMHKRETQLNVSISDINNPDVYKDLLKTQKTAIIVNGSVFVDVLYFKKVINNCIEKLTNNKLPEEKEFVFVLDGFEIIFNDNDKRECNSMNEEGTELIYDLFDKHNDSDFQNLKIIISGQRINQMPIISNIQENIDSYQYIDFSTDLEVDGEIHYKRMNQLENIARAVEKSKVYEK